MTIAVPQITEKKTVISELRINFLWSLLYISTVLHTYCTYNPIFKCYFLRNSELDQLKIYM